MFHPVLNLKKNLNHSRISSYFFDIVQIGTGGNGGYLVQRLSKMLHAFSVSNTLFKFRYTLVDGDLVEEKNLMRQPFIQEDVGMPKAKILADRYGNAYDIPIYYNDKYMDTQEDIDKCFHGEPYSGVYVPVLIGCVDNNATRQLMHKEFEERRTLFYLDSGIDSVSGDTPLEIEESGYSGQVVMGVKLDNKIILEPTGVIYSNILEDVESKLPTEACGDTVVNHPQRMQTNETAALIMASYLNNLLGSQKVMTHYTNFNALTMTSKPTYIQEEIIL